MLETVLIAAWTVFSPDNIIGRTNASTFEAYARAMTAYEATARSRGRELVAYFITGRGLPDRAPWTWFGPNGSSIQRIGDGRYRVSHGDPARNWFQGIDCELSAPAGLACGDGSIRKLSAPDLETVIVGDVTYRRVLPSAAEITVDVP